MPEQKAEKKKPVIFRRILKWFGPGLLSVLIILGLIFQAPWKVIALLLIILAACTQLPRSARKWFWLSAAAIIIALIIWIFLPDNNKGWRPYTFDEELATLKAKYAIPDSENATIIYNELLLDDRKYEEPPDDEIIAELKEKGEISVPLHDFNDWLANRSYSTFYPELWNEDLEDLTTYEFWSSKEHPRVAEWLQQHKGTIAKLIEASKLEKCLFPIPSDTFSLGESMERLAPMRRWAKLLIRATNNDLGDGRINQAIEKNLAVLQIAKHQYQQPTTLDLLVAMGIEAFATKQFNKFVVTGNATEEHLSVIEKALAEIKHDWGYDLPRILECEKLMMKNMLCSMFYQVNPKGKTRLSRDPTALLRAQYPQAAPPPTYWQKKFAKARTIPGLLFSSSTPQKDAKIIDESFERLYAMADPDFDWQKGPKKFSLTSIKFNFRCIFDILVSILEPAYHKVHDQYLRAIAEQRGSRIIIALRRYKNKNDVWPESLNDIKSIAPEEIFVDPFNEGSFVYKLIDDSFKLYSKGLNNIDEDGKYKRRYGETSEGDDWLIWPPRTRKTQKENADAE
jgi:hypothetical protein